MGIPRTRAHTDLLVRNFELGELWDAYGIVGDVMVRHFLILIIYFRPLLFLLRCVTL